MQTLVRNTNALEEGTRDTRPSVGASERRSVYMRVVGTVPWTLVGIRRQKVPFDDQIPLPPGVAETREYQARAVVGDDEVGVPSDIVQVTFAG